MKLNDLNRKNVANSALKENFDFSFNTSKLDRAKTRDMLGKVSTLIKEAQSNSDFYNHQTSPAYLKLVFMHQALTEHFNSLKAPKIVVENEEVQKSEVILAAQDMLNSIQKMIEEVNDMLVKELPALTDSIQSEIGVNESQAYNQAASGALTQLNQTLSQTRIALADALNQLTNLEGGDFSAPTSGGDMAVTDIGAQAGGAPTAGPEMPADMSADIPAAPEEPEELGGAVGRAKR